MKKKIWFDFTNTPHVLFLYPVYKKFRNDFEFIFTIRDFAETKKLFSKMYDQPASIVGAHKGGNKLMKVLGSFTRVAYLNKVVREFDIKISVGGDSSNYLAKLRGKPSITFDDNETAPNFRYAKFTDLAIWPKVIDRQKLLRQGFTERKIYQYNGFKEDFYISEFVPQSDFLSELPCKNYIIFRPENVQANYVDNPESQFSYNLLKVLNSLGRNILFLPRYKNDHLMAKEMKNVFVLNEPKNGLDLIYNSDGVLTGAGTITREAAALGIPALSFYAGSNFLAVDKKLFENGKIRFSRNIAEIINFVNKLPLPNRSIPETATKVRDEILDVLEVFFQERRLLK